MARPKLTKLELQVMDAFWRGGPSSVREVQERFPDKDRPAYTTIQTMVYRLEAKKAIRRVKKIGNAHIFEAVVSRADAQRRFVDDLLALLRRADATRHGAPGRVGPADARRREGSGTVDQDTRQEGQRTMSSLQLVSDHLWQSTLVAGAIAIIASTLRRKRAGVRYLLWLAASVKFMVPFAALTAFGAMLGSWAPVRVPGPAASLLQDVASAPFVVESTRATASVAEATTASGWAAGMLPAMLLALWAAGCVLVLAAWIVRWSRAALAVRAGVPLDSPAARSRFFGDWRPLAVDRGR